MTLGGIILLLVTLQRVGELWLSVRNTRRLLAQGAREHGSGHYPLIIAVHVLWMGLLWWLAPLRPVDPFWLAIFVLLQVARMWVIATLGRRWTTRIIVVPDAPLVRSGPYRFLNHPNYWVVAGEIAVLPLVFGLWEVALLFSLLNAAAIGIRVRAEIQALSACRSS